eukprot:gnl/Chilomastix_cuspidata/5786.p2 GENE.gnl/Chilomastix_cuspidata/5786~~gnl/Chilomastix_cuspidata/5786.p2  ORF type:complete len:148 (-),score=24.51 gnl/Chilomastix_cuspidata/5786:338-781(-)
MRWCASTTAKEPVYVAVRVSEERPRRRQCGSSHVMRPWGPKVRVFEPPCCPRSEFRFVFTWWCAAITSCHASSGPRRFAVDTGGWCDVCSQNAAVPSAKDASNVSPSTGLNGFWLPPSRSRPDTMNAQIALPHGSHCCDHHAQLSRR